MITSQLKTHNELTADQETTNTQDAIALPADSRNTQERDVGCFNTKPKTIANSGLII